MSPAAKAASARRQLLSPRNRSPARISGAKTPGVEDVTNEAAAIPD
jgi:hypothetical protein